MNRCLIGLATALASVAILPAGSSPPAKDDCQGRIAHAYDGMANLQKRRQGKVLVVNFSSETQYLRAGQKKPATSVTHFVLMSHNAHTFMSDGTVEIYRDDQHQVCIVRPQHLVLITYAEKQAQDPLAQWSKMREELLTQAHITTCEVLNDRTSPGPQRRIVMVPNLKSTLKSKVSSVEYVLDAQTDVLAKMTMYYPVGTDIVSSSLTIQGQRLTDREATVDAAALSHVLGPDNKLLPAYRAFELQDQRQN